MREERAKFPSHFSNLNFHMHAQIKMKEIEDNVLLDLDNEAVVFMGVIRRYPNQTLLKRTNKATNFTLKRNDFPRTLGGEKVDSLNRETGHVRDFVTSHRHVEHSLE